MRFNRDSRRGFTLIELLTVIAIIGILASLTAVVLPRALERARIQKVRAAMNNVRTALLNYNTQHASFPPAYGFLRDTVRPRIVAVAQSPADVAAELAALTPLDFEIEPYMWKIELFNVIEVYDTMSQSGDTDRDGEISLLEYQPFGTKTGPTSYVFDNTALYNGSNFAGEVARQLDAEQRPLVYIPANRRQVAIMAQWWFNLNSADPRPRPGDPIASSPLVTNASMLFPPPSYDVCVLMSVGPDGTTRGLIPPLGTPPGHAFAQAVQEMVAAVPPQYGYHVIALAAYYMASRDANDNGLLDFDFEARSRGGEARIEDASGNFVNQLPDPLAPSGYGPMILVVE